MFSQQNGVAILNAFGLRIFSNKVVLYLNLVAILWTALANKVFIY